MLDPPTLTQSFGSTSSSLIKRAQARDPEAWERLVELYSPLVYYWFRGTRLPAEDAADLMQEVFRSVSVGIARFAHNSNQASFRDFLRKRPRLAPQHPTHGARRAFYDSVHNFNCNSGH
jgi:hypothetical protein